MKRYKISNVYAYLMLSYVTVNLKKKRRYTATFFKYVTLNYLNKEYHCI